MLKKIKFILVGFLVSFVGTLPLGYLNLIGFEIFKKFGNYHLWSYFFGIVVIEVIVVYLTIIFAKKIQEQKKLLQFIQLFSIAFFLFLAYSFYTISTQKPTSVYLMPFSAFSPFVIGLFLSCINLQQWPYWTAWNLYLSSNNYIDTAKKTVFFYVTGTAIGTLTGMYAFVYGIECVFQKTNGDFQSSITALVPVFFLVLAMFQLYKFFKKKN